MAQLTISSRVPNRTICVAIVKTAMIIDKMA